jgi:ABC-type multidrug transport system fused ATPase/permease subunit
VDAPDVPLAQLRSLLTLVSQDTYLFHATVAEKLRLARPDADQAAIDAATRAANAHDFIAHRLSTIISADRVVMIDRGQVVASGRHVDLVAAAGP